MLCIGLRVYLWKKEGVKGLRDGSMGRDRVKKCKWGGERRKERC